jgi:hypothetical protein
MPSPRRSLRMKKQLITHDGSSSSGLKVGERGDISRAYRSRGPTATHPTGRGHLKRWLDDTLRQQFTGTSHHIGNHIIEFDDVDHAHGVVYSKNEHETPREDVGTDWVIMQMLYWDNYERIEGRWYFRRRLPCYWYATDLNSPPVGDNKMRWPDRERYEGAYHALWPSWEEFWANPPREDEPEVAAPAPLEHFLIRMRRGSPDPQIRVR